MRQHPANGAYFWSGHKIVFVLRNVFRNPNGILPHGAKRVCQFFAAVNAHGITSLWDCLLYPWQTVSFDARFTRAVTRSGRFFLGQASSLTAYFPCAPTNWLYAARRVKPRSLAASLSASLRSSLA